MLKAALTLFVVVMLQFAVVDSAKTQPQNPIAPSIKNQSQLCSNGILDSTKLASWYYYNDTQVAKAFKSPLDIQNAFQNRGTETGSRKEVIDDIAAAVQVWTNAPNSGFVPNVKPEDVDADNFLAGKAPTLMIRCVTPSTSPTPTPTQASGSPAGSNELGWLNNFRVRGTSDSLLVPRNTSAYSSAAGASLSFSQNGTKKSTTNALQAAIGYDLHFPPSYKDQHWPPSSEALVDVIPFVAVDRNITDVSGKPSSSNRENVTLGILGSLSQPLTQLGGHQASNVFSATAQHTWNDIDDSQLNYAHFVDSLVINGILNDYFFVPCCSVPVNKTWFAARPILDLRADLGFYSDRGLTPAKNHNYSQLGTQFGIAVSLESISSDLKVTHTFLYQLGNFRNNINLFEVAWTYNIIGKDVGLQASYQNGNLEATAQRIEQWMISLNVKY
jgi:hypothetical protein